MTNYESAVDRIKRCNTGSQLRRAEKGFARVHSVGQLSDLQLLNLDKKIAIKMIEVTK